MRPPEGMKTSKVKSKRPRTKKTDGQKKPLNRPSLPGF
jgi:hypothetical protein